MISGITLITSCGEGKIKPSVLAELEGNKIPVQESWNSKIIFSESGKTSAILYSDHLSVFEENKEITQYLNNSQIFGVVSPQLRQKIAQMSQIVDYPAGSEVLSQGKQNNSIFFLMRGTLQIYVDNKHVVDLQRKGDVIGEMSIISNKPCAATVLAATEVKLFEISRAHLTSYKDFDEGDQKRQRHTVDVKRRDLVALNLDYRQMGVGGDNSWGAWPHPEYRLPAKPYTYKLRLRPISRADDPAQLSRQRF